MKRPGYREAIEWLAYNDDNEWLRERRKEYEGPGAISVTAACIRDLYDVTEEKLCADLYREIQKRDANK